MCSSTIEEQTALISDRIECIKEVNTAIKTPSNITITDCLLFLPVINQQHSMNVEHKWGETTHVDHVVHTLHINDFAHCTNNKWMSLQTLPTVTTKGM